MLKLKIKDSVDLKELEKYGLKPKYDVDTGKIKRFESYRQKGILHPTTFKTLFYEYKKDTYVLDDKCDYYKEQDYRVDTELLYDLIKADLVEKVSD